MCVCVLWQCCFAWDRDEEERRSVLLGTRRDEPRKASLIAREADEMPPSGSCCGGERPRFYVDAVPRCVHLVCSYTCDETCASSVLKWLQFWIVYDARNDE